MTPSRWRLIVDDDRLVLATLGKGLRDAGYRVSEASDAANELGALGYLVKPLDVPQIIPEIEAALARATQISELKDKGEQLSQALESGRETSMAVGILMERRHLDRDEAFEALRSYARSQRRRVQEVAAQIVDAAEALNKAGRTH